MSTKKHLFTLVELLGVMGLIAILAALGFSGYSYAMTTAKDKSTHATIKRLEAGLEAIKTKQGYYPSTKGNFKKIKIKEDVEVHYSTGTPKGIFRIIVVNFMGSNQAYLTGGRDKTNNYPDIPEGADSSTKKEQAARAFLNVVSLDTLRNFIDSDGYLLDAWGNPIYYCYPAKIHSSGFDLISAGPDDIFGEVKTGSKKASDGGEPVEKMSNYRENGTPLCDDVMND